MDIKSILNERDELVQEALASWFSKEEAEDKVRLYQIGKYGDSPESKESST